MHIPFIKMNGAGNDFVIFREPVVLSQAQIQAIAHRDNAVTGGCDQLIVLSPSNEADIFMRIYNADGSEVDACGNATRCVGWLFMKDKPGEDLLKKATIETAATRKAGSPPLECEIRLLTGSLGKGPDIPAVTVNMGSAKLQQHLAITTFDADDLWCPPTYIDMGNPHIVFFVKNIHDINKIEKIGYNLQTHSAFLGTKGVNVSIVFPNSKDRSAMMRVWERGVGLTQSCGTAACAVMVSGIYNNLFDNAKWYSLRIQGKNVQTLEVCLENNNVFLSGAVEIDNPSGILEIN